MFEAKKRRLGEDRTKQRCSIGKIALQRHQEQDCTASGRCSTVKMGLQRHPKNSTALQHVNNSAAAPDTRQTGPIRKFKPNLTQIKCDKFQEALKHKGDSIIQQNSETIERERRRREARRGRWRNVCPRRTHSTSSPSFFLVSLLNFHYEQIIVDCFL